MCEICDKSISKEKHEKLRNYFFKMKELNEVFLGKGLFISKKEKPCLTKGHFGDQERQVEVECPPHQNF